MKCLIFVFILVSCAYGPSSSTPKAKASYKVLIQEDSILKNSDRFHTSYSLSKSDCKITWYSFGLKKSHNYNLALRYNSFTNCPSFEKQLPLHQIILSQIFADQANKKIVSITTPSLYLMEPSYRWNLKIVQAAVHNKQWQDFTKNYPNHSSGSANHIFVDIANQTNAYAPLKELFHKFHKDIRLKSVEKVFAQKSNKLPLKHLLEKPILTYPKSLLYDAGQLYYIVL